MKFATRLLAASVLILSCLAALAADDSADFNQRLQRGFSEIKTGSYRQAASDFKAANKLKHGQCDVCYLGIAAAHLHMGQFSDSVDSCKKAVACASAARYKAEAHAIWGDALAHMAERDPKKANEALEQYRESATADPTYAAAHLDLGVALLRAGQDDPGKKELQAFLQLSPSGEGADMARKLIANPDRARFNFAPDFHATTAAGQNIALSQFEGKVVVLDFWATWCGPCRSSVPELKDLTKKYPSEQLQVISISADSDAAKWRDFIAKKGMDWPQIWDSDGSIRNVFAVSAFPTYLVLDRQGIIRQRIVGINPQQTIVARLKSELAKMLE